MRRRSPGFGVPDPASVGRYLGQPEQHSGDQAQWTLMLDGRHDPVLRDHTVDGLPTLPGTFALEIAAEAATVLVPGTRARAFHDTKFEAFIHARTDHPSSYTVRAAVTQRERLDTTVRVVITSTVTRHGRVLRADRPHFETDVTVTRSPARAPAFTPWPRQPLAPAEDPCYRDDGIVRLSGMFRNTTECRTDNRYAAARWYPSPQLPTERLGHTVIPALLLDALIRTTALPTAVQHGPAVPHRLGHVGIHLSTNDLDLAAQHPEGIRLVADTTRGHAVALGPDDSILAEMTGLTLAGLGSPALSAHSW
ncbi:hypothetical protein ABZ863_06005 [Saccharomonospora sp. NPDC046836]|uniref:hypothetical protein n=1 Tax=Saccharomonospora sp. NPDC046836 TaxID=3156921 RepID=UPI0033EC069D